MGQCLATSCGGTSCAPGTVCEGQQCVPSLCVGVSCPQGKVCASGVCSYPTDGDGDGRQGANDNCPDTFNPAQADRDSDGVGDPCDCAPDDPWARPGIPEQWNDSVDNDCDGLVDCADPDAAPDCDPEGVDATGVGPICTNGWCWESPTPQGFDLNSTWGAGPNHVWAVGAQGTILRWRGAGWARIPSNTALDLFAVWGSGRNDVWAAGDVGALLHWNGSAWTNTGAAGAPLYALWGSSFRDVWAVGALGTSLHWNGKVWTPVPTGVTAHLKVVWGASTDDVWAGGTNGTLLHWNGNTWSSTPSGIATEVTGVGGLGPGELFATPGLRWTGASWLMSSSCAEATLYAVDPETLFCGTAYLWNGSDWEHVTHLSSSTPSAVSLWGSSKTDVWGVGPYGLIAHWNGGAWSRENTGVGMTGGFVADHDLRAVAEVSPSELWVVGLGGTRASWNGATWTQQGSFAAAADFMAISSPTPTNAWVVTGIFALTYRWDGSAWAQTPNSPSFYCCSGLGIHATSPSSAWRVGTLGFVHQWNGSGWYEHPSQGSSDLYAVWGPNDQDVWVAGPGIFHWNGVAWAQQVSGSPGAFRALSGIGPSDVWAVGAAGATHHWNGIDWTAFPPQTQSTLYAVHARSATNAWAAGAYGAVLHWDGVSWTYEQAGTLRYFRAVVEDTRGEVRVFGERGAILRRQ